MDERERLRTFEQAVLPHLDAAYNLARWLAGNDPDAQDVAQEACLRAFRFFGNFRGDNARAWLLAIVRNTFYSWRQKNRRSDVLLELDEEALTVESLAGPTEGLDVQLANTEAVRHALETMEVEFREILILREMEGFSYREIAELVDLPMGTVMSRLARARKQLQKELMHEFKTGGAT